MAGRLLLGIRLGFHNHAPEQAVALLAFHQQATNQVGGDQLGGAAEEGWEEGWEILSDGKGIYGYNQCLNLEPTSHSDHDFALPNTCQNRQLLLTNI